ncbi:MAG TPA: FAD-dependent oxidoreductase [Spirochaetota bacterium]|nr:FAD-dependent oxidoreductase [Spirochaetota bacterium]
MVSRIVIAGFGSAGYAALMAIKRNDPKAEITVIDPKERDLMHPCGIPYSLENIVEEEGLLQDIGLSRMNVQKVRARGLRIDTDNKIIFSEDGSDSFETPYDTAILATGYRPFIPPVPGLDRFMGNGVYTLASVKDLKMVRRYIGNKKTGIVVGGGAIGIEAAVALKEHCGTVTLIEMKDQLLPGVIDDDISKLLEENLKAHGINVLLSTAVDEFTGRDNFSGVSAGGASIAGDVCILAAGFRANTDLAENSGIECTPNGIVVDTTLRTSKDSVFAAGDCISAWSVIDGKTTGAKLATSAYKQGTVAGLNASGGAAGYRGTAGTFVTRAGNIEIAGTGYTTAIAREHGYDPVSGKIKSGILPEYFPGGTEITVKVLFDKTTGKLLGAQGAGERGAAERVNVISTAIEFDIPVTELPRIEMAYCPAVSEVYDPLLRAVDFGLRRMKRS